MKVPHYMLTFAGKSIAEWREFARRDDCLDQMVPSDLRQIIGTVESEFDARVRADKACRAKDEAMGDLFALLDKNGVDYSHLIS